MIALRHCIADGSGKAPKGLITLWPEDKPLPHDMWWLYKSVFTAGPGGEAIQAWDGYTPDADRIIEEVLSNSSE